VLVSLETHLTCSSEPVLELVNNQEEDLELVALQGAPQEVSLLLLPSSMLLLRPYILSILSRVAI